jgi:hypothetical protein
MNLFVWMVVVLLAWCTSAFAFENIEADAVYNGPIKLEVQTEFAQGLTMLKAQAESLGMSVREKDLQKLQQHMYDKALLKGECLDKAITIRKTSAQKEPSTASIGDIARLV